MDALAEHVTAVQVDAGELTTWHDRARAWARASRTALLEHPGVLSLALTKPPKGAALIAIRDQVEQLQEAGLTGAAQAVQTLRAYVFGSVAVEVQSSGWADPESTAENARIGTGDTDFERGLDVVISGLAR